MNESGPYAVQIDPAKRAEVEENIRKILSKNTQPLKVLAIQIRREKDPAAKVLIYQAMRNIDPNNQELRNDMALAVEEARKVAAQNQRTSSNSTSGSSPGAQSSADSHSSDEFHISPPLQAKMTGEERRQREEYVRTAKQEIPEAIARMRADLQVEVDRLAKEMKELPLRKKQAEETVERINRALKDAKIPEAVELNVLGKKPYNKWKESTKVKYLKGKELLGDLLRQREQARGVVAECGEALRVGECEISNIEEKYQSAMCPVGALHRVVFTEDDYEALYGYVKPILDGYEPCFVEARANGDKAEIKRLQDASRTEMAEFEVWYIKQKMAEVFAADSKKLGEEMAQLKQQRDGFMNDIVNGMKEAMTEARRDLRQEIDTLKDEANALKLRRGELQDRIQLAEKGLTAIGIQPPKQPQKIAQHVNYGWMQEGAPAQQMSTSQLISSQYSRTARK